LASHPREHLEARLLRKLDVEQHQRGPWMPLAVGIAALAPEVVRRLLAVRDHFDAVQDTGLLESSTQQKDIRGIVFCQQDHAVGAHVSSLPSSTGTRRALSSVNKITPSALTGSPSSTPPRSGCPGPAGTRHPAGRRDAGPP